MIKTIQDFDAVVFDMDGLLLDTESIALEAFTQANKRAGLSLDQSIFYRCVGTNHKTSGRILREALGSDELYQKLQQEWDTAYSEICDEGIPLMPGVLELLAFLKDINQRIAVATSSKIQGATKKLKKAGIYDAFEVIIGGDQVNEGKPAPDIYLLAAKALGVNPNYCLALEDSKNGTLSGLRAGMTVVQVPDLVQPDEELLQTGHIIVESLHEVKGIEFTA